MLFAKLISLVLLPIMFGAMHDALAQSAGEENVNVAMLLSSRHPVIDVTVLSKAAGDDDTLVADLLKLRLESKPPSLGINAEKVLLNFIEREDVRAALHEDVGNPDRFGLGSVILSRLDQIQDSALRVSLAKTALQMSSGKSKEDIAEVPADIKARINNLIANSSDASVKALAEK